MLLLDRASISSNDGRNDSYGVTAFIDHFGFFSRLDAVLGLVDGRCDFCEGPVDSEGGSREV